MNSEPTAGDEREIGGAAEARRLETMGRLAAGIAHDFNNVLAAIRGYGQIALRSLDGMAAATSGEGAGGVEIERAALARLRADVAAIDESAQRAATLTRLLATLSRPAGSEVAPLDVDAFAADLQGLARRLLPAGVEATLALGGGHTSALANEPALLQAALELILDLRDARPTAGRLEIATTGGGADSRVALVLRHPALSAGLPGPRARQLAVELLGRAGGELRLDDAPGDRALVLSLAAAPRPRPAPPAADGAPDRASATESATESATVLLVEDDDAVRRIARTVLGRLGYRVVPAGDGGEALRMVELLASDDVVPDLLVTDVTMPGMNGPQLAAELRRLAPGIGVLFMSGMGEPAASGGVASDARADFLEKPFTLDELAARVAGLLAGR